MNKLSRIMVIAGGLTLSGVLVASLAVAGNFGHHHKRGHIFSATMLDADGDGALTKDELLAHNRARFDRLDADGDGIITPDEFGGRLVAMFTRMDADSDGLLSGDELPRRMGRHGHHGRYHAGRQGVDG